jgi:hypothetical protein
MLCSKQRHLSNCRCCPISDLTQQSLLEWRGLNLGLGLVLVLAMTHMPSPPAVIFLSKLNSSYLRAVRNLSHFGSKRWQTQPTCNVSWWNTLVTRQLDVLCTVIDEASKHSDNSTLSSLASEVSSICTMGSAESDGIPPKPSAVFANPEMWKYHQVEPPSEIDCKGAFNEIPAATASPSPNTGGCALPTAAQLAHAKSPDSSVSQCEDGSKKPDARHTAAVISPEEPWTSIEMGNPFNVLWSLGTTRADMVKVWSPPKRKGRRKGY